MVELIAAIRYALWNQEDDSLQCVDWSILLREAEYHAVFGLAFQAMQHYVKQAADQMLLLDSISFVSQIMALNAVTNNSGGAGDRFCLNLQIKEKKNRTN